MPINALTAGVAALAINSTAFTIEIFRGGFAAVPVLPAFFIVLALSAAYVAYGALPTMRSAFYGLDTDHLANATTLVRCLEVNCRVGTLDVSVLPFFVPRLKRVISITPVS